MQGPTATTPEAQATDVAEPGPADRASVTPASGVAAITVAPAELMITESAGSGWFTITLNSAPTSAVTIPLTLLSSECTISPERVTLDSSNWSAGAVVAVAAMDDNLADGGKTCLLQTGAALSAGADYGNMQSDDVLITVLDDDAAAIVVAPTSVNLSEPVGSGAFSITLSSEPADTVAISVRPSNNECATSTDSVTLDSANWQSGAIVEVAAVDDLVADGEQICTVLTGPAASSGSDYNDMQSDSVSVAVLDDDTARIDVAPVSMALSEPEDSGTFTITLNTQPATTVSIALSPSNEECAISPEVITLDSSNWRRGATVAVTAVDDSLQDGERTCVVQTAPASSSGADYVDMQVADVSIAVLDDDSAGITITPTTISLSERAGSGKISVTLNSQPAAAVSISMTTSSNECVISPEAVTLDGSNWQSGAVVQVTAVDDEVEDGDQTCTVQTGPATSNGADYSGMQSDDVSVVVMDNDDAGIVLVPTTLRLSEPDGSGTFSVRLNSRPAAAVSISLTPTSSDCAVSSDTITLDSSNWQEGVFEQVTAVDDEVNDGEQTCTVQTGRASSNGLDYSGMQSADVAVTVLDDDVASIVVAPVSMNLSEPQGTGAFTVALTSQPIAAVSIPLTLSSDECELSGDTIALDGSNWRDGATVVVTVVDDSYEDGDQTCTVHTGRASSTGADYGDRQSGDVSITVLDDDVAGIAVAPTTMILSEPEGSATFTVTLSSRPSAVVSIPLTADSSECVISQDSVTVDGANWRSGATIQVMAVDDEVDDGEQTCTVQTGPASSDGADYSEMQSADVSVAVLDDDVAGIVLTPPSLDLSEPGGSGAFTVTLNSQPAAAVSIPLAPTGDECTISPSAVTLDSSTWQLGVVVKVTAVDDELDDGEQTCTVQTGPASSSGTDYGDMQSADVAVAVQDDDAAGIVVAPTAMSLSEPVGSGAITVTLSSQPAAPVSIPLTPASDECAVSPNTVTLDSSNWQSGVTVRIVAIDDQAEDGEQTCIVQTGPASSSGADYQGMVANEVAVAVADDDTAGIVLALTDVTVEESGVSDAYAVALSSKPTSSVVVGITTDGQTAVIPDRLTFTSLNWSMQQPVTISVADDNVAQGERSSNITHTASSDDQNYGGLAIDSVTATIRDDDSADLVAEPSTLYIAEGGEPVTYRLALAAQPTQTLTIGITTDGQTVVTPTLLTFAPPQWDVPLTVTVAAVDDPDSEGRHFSNITHTVTSSILLDLDVPASIVMAEITDNEVLGVLQTLRESITGLFITVRAEETPAGPSSETVVETEERARGLSPTTLLVAVVAVVAIFAIAVELFTHR